MSISFDVKTVVRRGITYFETETQSVSCKQDNVVVGFYQPKITVPKDLREFLDSVKFTRVRYISQYGKINNTPRYTWCWGIVEPDDGFRKNSKPSAKIVSYKPKTRSHSLNFIPEAMPPILQELSMTCRKLAMEVRGFDPGYNSCIIGKYEAGEDSIAFHTDAETFLATKFCANVTIGAARDFHFKFDGTTYGIKLANESLFFFDSLEHRLPPRKHANEIRYSISFRNMASDIGIGNSYYYCRGLEGAVDDSAKADYVEKMRKIQESSK